MKINIVALLSEMCIYRRICMADSSSQSPVKHNSVNILCFQLIFINVRRRSNRFDLSLMIVIVLWKSHLLNASIEYKTVWNILTLLSQIEDAV